MRKIGVIFVLVLLVISGTATYLYYSFARPQIAPKTVPSKPNGSAIVDYKIVSFAQDLSVPWAIVFTSADRMLVSERIGRITEIKNETKKTLITFDEVSQTGEEGLMGMALDPNYVKNKNVYVCLAYKKNGQLVNAVKKLRDNESVIEEEQTILDTIPAAQYHAGCRIRIGPDNKLYVSTGDALQKNSAQDVKSLAGKILRINLDGSIPSDNPFPNSYVYSYGHRNIQGFDWHPITGEMYATEHGPSVFDGPPGGDEVNHIKKGANYGWPVVSHERTQNGMEDPLIVFTPAVAPASGSFYSGRLFPQFTHVFLFGGLRGEGIYGVTLDDNKKASYQKLAIDVGRVREVVEGPDGRIYFSTSNTDGRGNLRTGDDHIYVITKK